MSQNPVSLQVTVGGIAVVLLIGGAMWFGFGPDAEPPGSSVPTASSPVPSATVTVHVSGYVSNPGVVVVSAAGRVADAIAASGGATNDADLSLLNLAAAIHDGDHITVPGVEAQVLSGATEPLHGVDINTSSSAQLEGLPGVGPVLADRIVTYREANGPYAEVEDLLGVPGIGEAKLAGMRDDIADP